MSTTKGETRSSIYSSPNSSTKDLYMNVMLILCLILFEKISFKTNTINKLHMQHVILRSLSTLTYANKQIYRKINKIFVCI